MWIYTKHVERGSVNVANAMLWNVGRSNPQLRMLAPSGLYQISHSQDAASVTATLAVAPTFGQTVELLAGLSSTGAVTIRQSLDGAADTSAGPSGALALVAAWAEQTIGINGDPGNFVGFNAFTRVLVGAGTAVTTIAQARLYA